MCYPDISIIYHIRYDIRIGKSARDWGHQARDAPTSCPDVVKFLEEKAQVEASSEVLIPNEGYSKHLWYRQYSQQVPRQMTGLHLATYFGVEEATNCLLQNTVETDAKDTYSRTPLWYAAVGGYEPN